MAEAKNKNIEREYIIPLRREWIRVPYYERSGRAIKAIKKFIAKHMKILDRDVEKVKIDVYFNNELWFKGRANPPAKVKVKAKKEGDIVKVEFAEIPQYVRFLKAKHTKLSKKGEKKDSKIEVKEIPQHAHPEEKTQEQKKDEVEKEKSVEELNIKQAEQQAKTQKHTTKVKETPIQRMALKK